MIQFAPNSVKMSYEDAVVYCLFLEYDSYKDWEVPSAVMYWLNEQIDHSSWHINHPDVQESNHQIKQFHRVVTPVRIC